MSGARAASTFCKLKLPLPSRRVAAEANTDHIARCAGTCMAGAFVSGLNFDIASAGALNANASRAFHSPCAGAKHAACAVVLRSDPSSSHFKQRKR